MLISNLKTKYSADPGSPGEVPMSFIGVDIHKSALSAQSAVKKQPLFEKTNPILCPFSGSEMNLTPFTARPYEITYNFVESQKQTQFKPKRTQTYTVWVIWANLSADLSADLSRHSRRRRRKFQRRRIYLQTTDASTFLYRKKNPLTSGL